MCIRRRDECFSASSIMSAACPYLLSFCCVSPCWQSFSLTVLCHLNLPSFSPSLGFSVTALLFAVFSQSFPWTPPRYSSLSLECLPPPSGILCLLALFYFLYGTCYHQAYYIFIICLFPYKYEFFEGRDFVMLTSVSLAPRTLPAH